MNLSSYLQMPPAPNAPKSTASGPASGAAGGARMDAGNSLGLDFAHIMARQLERLPQMQRQDLAASAPQMPPAAQDSAKDSAHETQKRSAATQDRSNDSNNDRNSDDMAQQDKRPVRADAASAEHKQRKSQADTNQTQQRTTNESADDSDATLGADKRTHKSRLPSKARSAQEQLDAALLQALSAVPGASANNASPDSASVLSESKPSLQTIALSPHIQIITDPKLAPSKESLAEFAKSMGLDEATIQSLIATDSQAASRAGAASATDSNTVLAHALGADNARMAAASPGALGGSQALLASLSHSAGLQAGLSQANSAGVNTINPMVQGQANMSASLLAPDTQSLPGALLPPMSAADLASIEQIQITVMPAVLTASNSAAMALPSTQEVLSLMSAELPAQDISLLSAQFNEAGQQEPPADQQPDQHPSPGASFAQTLSQQSTPSAAASTSAAASSPTHMREVYDQLSDKLATEMAARMHKQLSDGEWKMKFGLRPAHLGGVEIQLEMKDGKLDAVFRADNPLTRDLLQNSSQRLREALENFGIHAGQVHVGQHGGGAQQNASRNSANQPQVGDNSTLQVKGDEAVDATRVASNKANASLLDLYA